MQGVLPRIAGALATGLAFAPFSSVAKRGRRPDFKKSTAPSWLAAVKTMSARTNSDEASPSLAVSHSLSGAPLLAHGAWNLAAPFL